MKNRLLILAILFVHASWAFGQDLIRKVPTDASVVFTFNNKAFFEKVGVEKLNSTLVKFGFFKKALKTDIASITDLGIDLNSKAYSYLSFKDSVNYAGALIPLANKNQFESLLTKDIEVLQVNNLPTVYADDKKLRISWDDHTIYILSVSENDSFFSQDDVRNRYGLLSSYGDDYDYDDVAVVIQEDSIDWDEIDTLSSSSYGEGLEIMDSVAVIGEYEEREDYRLIDSVLAQDEYADDYYSRFDSIYRYNDSIKNTILSTWADVEFTKLLSTNNNGFYNSSLKSISNNTLIQMYAPDLSVFFKSLYRLNRNYGYTSGFSTTLMPTLGFEELDFGLKSFEAKLELDKNKVQLLTNLKLKNDILEIYKQIYKRGVNPKFYKYLDKDILGFMTININTESYLKSTPTLLNKYYGHLLPRYKDYIDLTATILDITLDEKAISRVFKGDNLLVFEGVSQQTVTYTDYEYDDDYDYVEVEKTKTETLPQFLWMFTSEDNRVFQKLLQIGAQRNKLINNEGIYSLVEQRKSSMPVHFYIHNGIVFIGNDFDKIKAIRDNSKAFKGYSPYVAIAKKNSSAFLLNTKRIPSMIEELNLPVNKDLENFVNDLKQYGDMTITVPGVVGDMFKTDVEIEFPKNNNKNALQYLLDLIERSAETGR